MAFAGCRRSRSLSRSLSSGAEGLPIRSAGWHLSKLLPKGHAILERGVPHANVPARDRRPSADLHPAEAAEGEAQEGEAARLPGRPAERHPAELLPRGHPLYPRPVQSDAMPARVDRLAAKLPAAEAAAAAATAAAASAAAASAYAEMRAAKGRHSAELRVPRTSVRAELRVRGSCVMKRVGFAARSAAVLFYTIGLLLLWQGELRAASAPQLQAPGLPVIAVIGCRLVNGALVCGRDGTLLPNRLRRPKAKAPAKTYKPAQKKTPPAKSRSSKSGTSKSAPAATSGQDADAEPESDVDSTVPDEEADAQADDDVQDSDNAKDSDDEQNSAVHSCPPGHVVLEKPNAAGSHCEPDRHRQTCRRSVTLQGRTRRSAKGDAPAAAPRVPAGSTEIPDDIRAAACGPGSAPGACACPGGSTFDSDACKAAIPSCCSAEVSLDGKPQPAISRCDADQNKAMSAVVSSAMEEKLTLGPVRCTNR